MKKLSAPLLRRRTKTDPAVETHPWYHDFTPLGVHTPQAPGIYGPNQAAKQDVLFRYIEQAISRAPRNPRGLEMFCADGFYSHYALLHGATHMTGVDLGESQSAGDAIHLRQAEWIGKRLGHQRRAEFLRGDVRTVDGQFDFVICAGGLYHLEDPAALLRRCHANTSGALVVQTVYSLATSDADYFATPAPGWTWGCRFSLAHFQLMLGDTGWRILDLSTNELTGNSRLEDRGSVYALCVPA